VNKIHSEFFIKVRNTTEEICEPLSIEDYIPQPAVFTSPLKWQLGHTTWFFEEMILKPFLEGYIEFNPSFGFLFNSYYNHVGERTQRHERGLVTRPSVQEVYEYRSYINKHMLALIQSSSNERVLELTVLGLNHEQQHQELMYTDLKYTLAQNPLSPVYRSSFDLTSSFNDEVGWVLLDEGTYEIGYSGEGFCFDNELSKHKVYLQKAKISKHLVTNGDYLQFIEAGGYEEFSHWLDEGWSWVQNHKVKAPLYWEKIDDEWYTFTFSGLKKLNLEAQICHISFYEAHAFAAWKGMRLPTEFEWEIASAQLKWGTRWEWTNSAYLPYPGYKIAEGAVGEYNGKFMVNQMVLRGASTATAIGHSRSTYRNFFHPNFQWQFTGIRLAQ
jgi:ergothioneine biosynthesis protein EgtB